MEAKWKDLLSRSASEIQPLLPGSAKDGVVTIDRGLAQNFTFVGENEYPLLRDFYQKVAIADQQQLVLTRTPAAKGN